MSETTQDVVALLRAHGVTPTEQRISVASAIFTECRHLSADEIFYIVNARDACVSKATIYNTLGLLAAKGVIREVIADPARVFYDPNTAPHHHFYNETTGALTDIDAEEIQITGLPPLPEGASLQGIDVVIRLRDSNDSNR